MTYIVIGIIVVFIILYQTGKSQQKSDTNKTVTFNVQTNSPSKSENDSKWEIVNRKTERWTELGFGDGDSFPGYGRLYDREIKVWYCEIGSKEMKGERIIKDRFPLNYEPKNSNKLMEEGVYLDRLDNTRGYEFLFTGLDNKNRKRWYFALVNFTPTWIETDRAIEKENTEVEEEKILAPKGWELVINNSNKWNELGFNKNRPGYGKVFKITLEIWYSVVGSKEKIKQPNCSVNLALNGEYPSHHYLMQSVASEIKELKGKSLNLDRMTRTQGYSQLYNALDHSTKKRWYIGVCEMEPTYIFTTHNN